MNYLCPRIRCVPLVAVLVFLAAAGAVAPQSQEPASKLTAPEIYERFHSAVVTVEAGTSQGSGFFINETLFTCYHVIKGHPTATAVLADGTTQALTHLLLADPEADLAVFKLPQKPRAVGPTPSLLPKGEGPQIGDKLFVIGSPEGLDQTLSEGILSARRPTLGLLQLSAPISAGSSGSPVLDERGALVGMVTSQLREGQSLNFAVDLEGFPANVKGLPLSQLACDTSKRASTPSDARTITEAEVDRQATRLGLEVREKTFMGLNGVALLVEEIPAGRGVSEAQVEAVVRGCLRRYGIPVRDLHNFRGVGFALRFPILYVNVAMHPTTFAPGVWVYDISVELRQCGVANGPAAVRLVAATTWETGSLGAESSEGILSNVVGHVEEFCAVYRKANPAVGR